MRLLFSYLIKYQIINYKNKFMKHLFYFIAILPLLWEMINLLNVKRAHNFHKRMKLKKGFESFTSPEKSLSFLSLGYLIWIFIGLFSFQWIVFLAIIMLSLIPKKLIVIRWIDSLISFILLLFILLNAYHFKIDVFAALRSFLQ